jgi:hypothetical protein
MSEVGVNCHCGVYLLSFDRVDVEGEAESLKWDWTAK